MSECAAALISVSLTLTNLSAKKDSVISRKFVDKGELIDSGKYSSRHSYTHTEWRWISCKYNRIWWLQTSVLRHEILIFIFLLIYMHVQSLDNDNKEHAE